MTGVREAAAYDLGRAARVLGRPRQPWYDERMVQLAGDLPDGRGRPLLDVWLRGFDQATREAMAR